MPQIIESETRAKVAALTQEVTALRAVCARSASLAESAAVFCLAAPEEASGEFMYMPGGLHKIIPSQAGKAVRVEVLVDQKGAQNMERQRQAIEATGKKPFFDFNHENREASFWPSQFIWKDGAAPGIYARGEWSEAGRDGVKGKSWRQFSPVFFVDNIKASPAQVTCNANAQPNMGGLVNNPAFAEIAPLWASAWDAGYPEALSAKETELMEAEAAAEVEELRARCSEMEIKAKAHRESFALSAVSAAVQRGAIAARDTTNKERWFGLIVADPENAAMLAATPGHPALGGRLMPSATATAARGHGVALVGNAAKDLVAAYAALVAQNTELKPQGLSGELMARKGALAREAAAIYRRDLVPILRDWEDMPLSEALAARQSGPLMAADNSSTALGTLSGTLVLQRTLELLKFEFPELLSLYTDFSDQPGLLGQTEKTRVIVELATQNYNPTLDASGRPKGWDTVSPANAFDVSITLDEHVGVPVVFGVNQLAATSRQLFSEFAPMAMNALAGRMVNKVSALITPGNFNAYSANSFTGGATTSGSATVTMTSTAGLYPSQYIAGAGIPEDSFVLSIESGTEATLSQKASATAAGLTFSTSRTVPSIYATYAKALADFNVASLDELSAALTTQKVPKSGRTLLLNASYFARLRNDPQLGLFFAALQNPEIITKGTLPEVRGFKPYECGWFPNTQNRVGFVGSKSALVLKGRVPVDFTTATNAAAPGSVTTVTNPDLGLSVMLVQYVSLQGGYSEWRPEVLLGATVGDRRGGLILTAQ